MQVQMLARHATSLLEITREKVAETQKSAPGTNYQIAFTIQMQPGAVNDSELLSWLEKIQRAVAQFPQQEPLLLNVDLAVISTVQQELLGKVEDAFKGVVQLERDSQAAKQKLALAGQE